MVCYVLGHLVWALPVFLLLVFLWLAARSPSCVCHFDPYDRRCPICFPEADQESGKKLHDTKDQE